MIVVLLTVFLAVVVWWVRRRRRAALLAGLNSAKPVFQVDPPRRRLGRLKDERL